jgi:hypothetical protein
LLALWDALRCVLRRPRTFVQWLHREHMASKIVVGWLWAEIHHGNLTREERRKIFQILFYDKNRSRRPVKKKPSSRVKGEKKEFDSNLMKRHFESQ